MSARKYHFTAEMDDQIRQVYRTNTGKSEVNELSVKLKLPRWRVSRRAREIMAYEPRIKEPNWSEAELKILKDNAHKTPITIRKILKKSGFTRSATGILLKRRRLEWTGKNLAGYSASLLAQCLGIDQHSITNLINKGHLKAKRRGTARKNPKEDYWWIIEEDIKKFIIESIGLIDIRKVDKFWLVDILTGSV